MSRALVYERDFAVLEHAVRYTARTTVDNRDDPSGAFYDPHQNQVGVGGKPAPYEGFIITATHPMLLTGHKIYEVL